MMRTAIASNRPRGAAICQTLQRFGETESSQIPAQHSTVASQTSPVGAQFSIRQIGFPTANAHGPPQHVSVPMQVSPAAWQLRRRQVHLPSKQPHSPEQQSQLRRQAWSTRRQRC
jgi:hypothetical protein